MAFHVAFDAVARDNKAGKGVTLKSVALCDVIWRDVACLAIS